jgi:hypothetical protein
LLKGERTRKMDESVIKTEMQKIPPKIPTTASSSLFPSAPGKSFTGSRAYQ